MKKIKTLTDSELSAFSGQLAMILHSGISVLEGVSIIREDLPEGEGRQILNQVYESLEETGELAQSLEKSGVYPDYFLKMTEIGERSGTLEEIMTSLSSYYERQHFLIRSIRDALTYPLILLGMLFAVLLVLMTQVMPVFRQVFEQLGVEVTGLTKTVFNLSTILQNSAIFVLILVVLLLLCCIPALRSETARAKMLSIVSHIPAVKRTGTLLACSRFSNALSLALHSGLDMGESFELAAGLVTQEQFKEKVSAAAELLEQGNEFGESLRDAGVFTGLNARMVSIGFRTGSAEDALEKISASCQQEADEQVQTAVGALEPTLTAVLSILTGLILVSVMLPLLGIMTNIG